MDIKKIPPEKSFFILGGTDNEMEEIKRILDVLSVPFFQPQANWGNIEVSFKDLPATASTCSLFIFVECRPLGDYPGRIKIIDHHGDLNQKPASLLQVLKFLRKKPSLRQKIIASIDSHFLKQTIRTFPRNHRLVHRIWESGYRKRFETDKEWKEFKHYCLTLWKKSKTRSSIGDNTVVVWNAPGSMTYLAALANLESKNCVLVSGTPTTYVLVPVLFQGRKEVVEYLSQLELEKAYWGRGYFGCRAIPADFISHTKDALQFATTRVKKINSK